MKNITKSLIGTAAAGAMALASAAPAIAQGHGGNGGRGDHGDRHDNNGISAGEVIAGALIIGGIAAIASSGNDRGGRGGYGDGRYGNPRSAVEQCVNAAENRASRSSFGGRAKVTDVRKIDRDRNGFTVKGRIAVNSRGHNWRNGDSRYGNGWGGDYRGYNDNLRGYDAGKFSCRIGYNGQTSVSFSGIRGLR